MSDEHRELVPVAMALGHCDVGRHFYVTGGQIQPLRRVGVDGPGWQSQIRARHQDRQWRQANGFGLQPRTRESGATARRSGASEASSPRLALSGSQLRSAYRARVGRAAAFCFGVAVLVALSEMPHPWDLVLALALLAAALVWAVRGLHRREVA